MTLSDWLVDGDVPDADWVPHLLGLMSRGDLGHTGDLLLDLPALAQPYACVSGECAPGRRAKGMRSCCADVEVMLTKGERSAVVSSMAEIRAHLAAHDPRWRSEPAVFDGDHLARPGRRCVFAIERPEGLRCGLHELEDGTGRPRGALKPMPCRLFPLVVVALDDGRIVLSAVHRRTARLAGARPARAFPCLRGDRAPLVHGVRDTIVELWGQGTYRAIRDAVARWRSSGR